MAIRFGIIFITDYFTTRDSTTDKLRSILEACNSIWFRETSVVTHITPKVFEGEGFIALSGNRTIITTAFIVSTNEPDAIFNLKNYLLVLAKNFDRGDIWYCGNGNNIELVSNTNNFGEVLDTVESTLESALVKGTLDDILQLLVNRRSEFYFHKKIINNRLPFGIIFIASNSDNSIDIDDKTKKLESCFCDDMRSDFFYYPIRIEDYLILDNLKSCFVFQNEPNNNNYGRPFTLKQYLLELKEKLGFEPTGIFYCENANTHKIELIGNDSDFREILLEFSENIPQAPNELPQFLTNFKNSKSPNEKISFSQPKEYRSTSALSLSNKLSNKINEEVNYRYLWHGYSKIPQEKRIAKIKEQVNEEIKVAVDPLFRSHRVRSEQNRKINEIAEGLKSGKIFGKKIIANAFDLNASYCFITPDGLKNLKERLFIQQDIINAINQRKRIAIDHAQIDDIKYNLLDSAFYFIFNVGNSSQLAIIKVPRKDLENIELPNTKKNIFNRLIESIYTCINNESLFLENDKTINDLNLEDLLGQLKTQTFPLSDTVINTINKKEGVALNHALINNIKYNTFHFIFDIGNPLLKVSSQLIIEVPREALDLENVDRLVEDTLSRNYSRCSQSSLVHHISEGSYIIDLHLIND